MRRLSSSIIAFCLLDIAYLVLYYYWFVWFVYFVFNIADILLIVSFLYWIDLTNSQQF